jgi:hypothetical protein
MSRQTRWSAASDSSVERQRGQAVTNSHIGRRNIVAGIVVVCVCLLAVGWFCWDDPNAEARARVRSILLSDSTAQQQLEDLGPYVKDDEHISAVHARLAPCPKKQLDIDRPTEHAYGLGDASLVLAIRANGTVAGIGRHIHGSDDGTVWLEQRALRST